MTILVLTIGLFRSVYRGGLEALFNYVDNNFTYQTAGLNLKASEATDRLRQSFKKEDRLLMVKGRSDRKVMKMHFSNVIERSYVGRRLLIEQVVVELLEK